MYLFSPQWMVFSWNGRVGLTVPCRVDQENRAAPVYAPGLFTGDRIVTETFKKTELVTTTIAQVTIVLLFTLTMATLIIVF